MLSLNQMINAMPTLSPVLQQVAEICFPKRCFYWCPKENTPISPVIPWFEGQIMGKGTLGKMMKSTCSAAGIKNNYVSELREWHACTKEMYQKKDHSTAHQTHTSIPPWTSKGLYCVSRVLYFRYSACDVTIEYLYGKYIENQYFDPPMHRATIKASYIPPVYFFLIIIMEWYLTKTPEVEIAWIVHYIKLHENCKTFMVNLEKGNGVTCCNMYSQREI